MTGLPESFEPFSDPALSKYLEGVLEWHGYIRFLGLPHLRENPDVTIERLYVEPNLSERWISPDASPSEWPKTLPALEVLGQHPRLVLLGDPGSGKSTLVNWLACQLALKPAGPVSQRLGRLIPLPMVVRELTVTRSFGWDSLLEAFLQRPVARPLGEHPGIENLLLHGDAFVMLDGLDELGSLELRARLRAAIFEGMRRYPGCRWLFTSRIVGYEDVPFHVDVDAASPATGRTAALERDKPHMAEVRFVAPFDDEQIRRFAANWFAYREAVGEQAQAGARALVDAVSPDRAILRLARTPNLLTMMALIFRVRARLPHGRALLYNEITDAYLQSIDEFRKLTAGAEYPAGQKRRWLARVGFEMQIRRSAESSETDGEPPEILVDEPDVRRWIVQAMSESGYGRDERAAAEFVDYVARRSGLLLPRGEGKFAFMHLSFQEYFAARFLEEQVTSPLWFTTGEAAPGAGRTALVEYARQATWRESMVFLFELLADRPGWPQVIANVVFGENFKSLGSDDGGGVVASSLLAQLTVNPHSGFTDAMRAAARDVCWQWEVGVQRAVEYLRVHRPDIARILLSAEADQIADVWQALISAASQTDRLTLRGATVTNVSELAQLTGLRELDLGNTLVTDIEPLTALEHLWVLRLDQTPFTNTHSLQRLRHLINISLAGTKIVDLRPLAALTGLKSINLSDTAVEDFRPLAAFRALQYLYLDLILVSDLSPLIGLENLRVLFVGRTKVSNLSPLTHLNRLETLGAPDTGVADLRPLAGLSELNWLMLNDTAVADLTPLAGLTKLEELFLDRTNVTDLHPLVGLTGLRELHLRGTQVIDLGPLAGRPDLKIFR